jgi:predicted AlkP superfamily phosphohydrolase/phosphomutase
MSGTVIKVQRHHTSRVTMELLVIGVDGMEPSLYERWRDDLPTLRGLEEDGGFARLRSTYLPLSAPAWASFQTGTGPGRHGIIDFVRLDEDHQLRPLNGDDIDGERLHELLAEDMDIGVLNLPYTYPPGDVDGDSFIVSGMTAPGIESDFASPAGLSERLRDEGYRIEWEEVYDEGHEDRSIEDIHDVIDTRHRTMMDLADEDLDVFIGVFTTTDRVQHWFWKHMDEDHPMHRERHEEYSDTIKETYERIDTHIAELIEETDPDNIIVLSDHGFGPIEKGLNINNWLLKKGYMKIKRRPLSMARYAAFKAGFTITNATKIVQKLGLSRYLKKSSEDTRNRLLKFFLGFHDIDWDRTRAFSIGNFGPIYINDERWDGVVDEDERQELIEEITADLRDMEWKGEQVIEEIRAGDDVLGGTDGPDIVFRTTGMRYMASRYFEFGSGSRISKTPPRGLNGHHRPDGVLFASGNDIDGAEAGAIEDLAPTILHLLGRTIPADMDGDVLDIFSDDSDPGSTEPQIEENSLSGLDL